MKKHDEVFAAMGPDEKRRMIEGEILIVTKGGQTTVEVYERPAHLSRFTEKIVPSEFYGRAAR